MFGNSNWKALRKIQTNGRVGYGNAMMRTIGAVTRKQCCSYDTGIRKSQATSYYETNYLTDNNNCDKHNSNAIRNHFRYYSSTTATTMPQSDAKNTVRITYIESNGKEITVDAEIGKNLMEVAHDNNIDLEGACGGELACSTCHVILEDDIYKTLPEKEMDECDMLDLAYAVTETSRLGCQIRVREDFDGIKVRIPDDGF